MPSRSRSGDKANKISYASALIAFGSLLVAIASLAVSFHGQQTAEDASATANAITARQDQALLSLNQGPTSELETSPWE